jgi:hypothetical protein
VSPALQWWAFTFGGYLLCLGLFYLWRWLFGSVRRRCTHQAYRGQADTRCLDCRRDREQRRIADAVDRTTGGGA